MTDTTFISIAVAFAVLLGAAILIKGTLTGFIAYMVALALIFGFAG